MILQAMNQLRQILVFVMPAKNANKFMDGLKQGPMKMNADIHRDIKTLLDTVRIRIEYSIVWKKCATYAISGTEINFLSMHLF